MGLARPLGWACLLSLCLGLSNSDRWACFLGLCLSLSKIKPCPENSLLCGPNQVGLGHGWPLVGPLAGAPLSPDKDEGNNCKARLGL